MVDAEYLMRVFTITESNAIAAVDLKSGKICENDVWVAKYYEQIFLSLAWRHIFGQSDDIGKHGQLWLSKHGLQR